MKVDGALKKDMRITRHREHALQMERMAEKYRQNVEVLRVTYACPEALTMALRRGEVIRLTLNKSPEDPDEFCKWLQNTVNGKLGVLD